MNNKWAKPMTRFAGQTIRNKKMENEQNSLVC